MRIGWVWQSPNLQLWSHFAVSALVWHSALVNEKRIHIAIMCRIHSPSFPELPSSEALSWRKLVPFTCPLERMQARKHLVLAEKLLALTLVFRCGRGYPTQYFIRTQGQLGMHPLPHKLHHEDFGKVVKNHTHICEVFAASSSVPSSLWTKHIEVPDCSKGLTPFLPLVFLFRITTLECTLYPRMVKHPRKPTLTFGAAASLLCTTSFASCATTNWSPFQNVYSKSSYPRPTSQALG